MKHILILFVKFYQLFISPLFVSSCRFYPSCSEYSIEALKKYGAIKGIWFTIKRVARCNPFHPGGYDPVP